VVPFQSPVGVLDSHVTFEQAPPVRPVNLIVLGLMKLPDYDKPVAVGRPMRVLPRAIVMIAAMLFGFFGLFMMGALPDVPLKLLCRRILDDDVPRGSTPDLPEVGSVACIARVN
jgi:hypothetical protein